MSHKEITQDRYDELLGCLPPIAMGRKSTDLLRESGENVSGWTGSFINSEPYSHANHSASGKCLPTFIFCYKKGEKCFQGITKPHPNIG